MGGPFDCASAGWAVSEATAPSQWDHFGSRAPRGLQNLLLAFSTWPEIEAWLAQSRTVVIPIGSNEQHGPTGLLGTDWQCPEIISHAAHAGGDILDRAGFFNIGMAQHHLAFPGTISLRPSTFQAAIGDWVSSLTQHGFDRLYFLEWPRRQRRLHRKRRSPSEIHAEWSFAEGARRSC